MIFEHQVKVGMDLLTSSCVKAFKHDLMVKNIKRQKDAYEDDEMIFGVLNKQQEQDQMASKPFTADRETATRQAEDMIHNGIMMRLKSAYVLYKKNEELDCIRHLLLALGVLTDAMGWEKASVYLNQQNNVLFDQITKENEKNLS